MRGDHPTSLRDLFAWRGTPPRARGSPRGVEVSQIMQRNTPACAGITSRTRVTRPPHPEHPRVRGDHNRVTPGLVPLVGTPPRARGSPEGGGMAGGGDRNTPACAGITIVLGHGWASKGEHPRVRGDHHGRGRQSQRRRGTPPRARGSLWLRPGLDLADRNTPACAGITGCVAVSAAGGEEHPRVRGDHRTVGSAGAAIHGTPPRARGSPLRHPSPPRWGRNTPACAGITQPSAPASGESREHPRVRGDHKQAMG